MYNTRLLWIQKRRFELKKARDFLARWWTVMFSGTTILYRVNNGTWNNTLSSCCLLEFKIISNWGFRFPQPYWWRFPWILYTWGRAAWTEFNNCPKRCDLFSLLHFCRQLYMFRVLTPIIRSWYSCNYSFWYWLTAMNKSNVSISSSVISSFQLISTRSCNYSCTSSLRWMSTPETCRAAYRNVINWISHILLDSY